MQFFSRSKHQRNRSLDSALQKIPESEPDIGTGSSSIEGHHLYHHRSFDQSTRFPHGHPPLKPTLSLSMDPCNNVFRVKDVRRFVDIPITTILLSSIWFIRYHNLLS